MTELDFNNHMDRDRRQFYRVVPSVEEPIILKVEGGAFPLIEISGGGCRLPIAARSRISDSDLLEIHLPGRSASIRVQLRPVAIGEKVFGAKFVGLDTAMREVICAYVRTRELELIRRFRAPAVRAS